MDLITALIAFIAALLGGGGIAAILDHRNKQRLAESQVKSSDIEAACKLIEQLEKRVERLSERVKYLEDQVEERDGRLAAIKKEYNERIDDLELELEELIEWIKAQGLKPPPRKRARKSE